ncbi:MAG: cytochrome c [Pelagimonas sp.]|jgi:mono/diheme cytochrome c family protein|uniref:Cytochrome C n=1 Tax=Actibacterium mucosum KCTC 23349 TaxID=1454373 RepID=A0A037ZML4_9RHOB|nr:cytochrome c [Actibacterium mucosum]KAJ56792.1 cytochrome C [Actibacterium mucosum KCTC 23349]
MNRNYLLVGACAVAAAAAYILLRPAPANDVVNSAPPEGSAMVAIQMPPIDGNAAIGQRIFENACVACHGINAVGVEGSGPPLIHVIYEPSHHADESFQRAVAVGVRSHHWRFGDMPPVEGLTRGDVAMVIAYIREIQRANGIN